MRKITKIPTIIIVLLLICTLNLTVQADEENPQAFIEGYITDESTGEPISNATVEIYDITDWIVLLNSTKTNENGKYEIEINKSNITIGIEVFADGYYNFSEEIFIPENETLKINFSLERNYFSDSIYVNAGGPYIGWVGHEVYFNGSGNCNFDDEISFLWDFGDGNNSTELYPSHIYESQDTYNVSLTVTNSSSFYNTNYTYVTILLDTENPSKVENLKVMDAKDGKLNLSWDAATDNAMVDYYIIYRNDESIYNTSNTFYQDTSLKNNEHYYYWIKAVDSSGNVGERSSAVSNFSSSTEKPIADAGGIYYGLVAENISFNGSNSLHFNPLGSLDYYWDFGDGNNGTGANQTHKYMKRGSGIYKVTLTVTDSISGYNDTNITQVILLNRPPNEPDIKSIIEIGRKDKNYTFIISSFDPDNDSLSFNIDWGDGVNKTIMNIYSGEEINISYSWRKAGKFIISVRVYDGEYWSNTSTLIFYVNSIPIDNGEISGYLLDTDDTGIHDIFYNDETGIETRVRYLEDDNTYLIDYNNDGSWDYIYNSVNGEIEEYHREKQKTVKTQNITLIFIITIIVGIAASLVVFLLYFKKEKDVKISKKNAVEKINNYDSSQNSSQFVGRSEQQKPSQQMIRYRVDRIPNNDNDDFNSFEGMIY